MALNVSYIKLHDLYEWWLIVSSTQITIALSVGIVPQIVQRSNVDFVSCGFLTVTSMVTFLLALEIPGMKIGEESSKREGGMLFALN